MKKRANDTGLARLLRGGPLIRSGIDWDLLVRRARRAGLLGRAAFVLEQQAGLESLPPEIRRHFVGAQLVADRQAEAVRWEVSCIAGALAAVGVPTLLLKGAAYVLAGLPPARGRLMSDIDILVPRVALERVESALMIAGWATTHHEPYDQRYYRRWMHELPPMRHVVRGSAVDVHHALLPVTARTAVDSEAIRAAAVPVPGHAGLLMLAPTDMVLHAATHLFHEGELHSGLRDLSDLDLLLRHFGGQAGFWDGLQGRAQAVGLARPLYHALSHCTEVLQTPVPAAAMHAISRAGPAGIARPLMHKVYSEAFSAPLASEEGVMAGVARWALFVRGHWLRMPSHLLVYHLAHKAIVGMRERNDRSASADRT